MNRKLQTTIRAMVAWSAVCICAAFGQEYSIDWHTVNGAGDSRSTGGGYEVSGTLGHPEAGKLTGGSYSLTGSFWALPPCWCLSDMNNDGLRNGEDIQDFVECLMAAGANCACADLEADGVLDMTDVTTFVDGLLTSGACP